jgi:hypothetical protein
MAKESSSQKKKVKKVMHEYKHGELKSGKKGKGGKVKSRKQAVAIAMHEAGVPRKGSKKKESNTGGRKKTSGRKSKNRF